MCPHRPDREESEMLQELQGLQAREPLPDIEPPALIDQAVRNMARREQPHQPSPLAGNLRWIAGLATASIALIALGISLVQAPTAPDPMYENPDTQKVEIRSQSEQTELASPAATSASRSARAPAADAVAVQEMAMGTENGTVREQQQETRTRTNNLAKDSALPDTPYVVNQAAEKSANADSDPLQTEEETAQAWLDSIQQLHEQGLRIETVEQLLAWQDQYPDLALPDWAADLLRDQP